MLSFILIFVTMLELLHQQRRTLGISPTVFFHSASTLLSSLRLLRTSGASRNGSATSIGSNIHRQFLSGLLQLVYFQSAKGI